MAKGECVFKALSRCLETPIEQLKEEFNYGDITFENGDPIPPGVHQIMDYFMEMGGALIPIARKPMSEHGGQLFYDFDPDSEAERWERYLRSFNGFLIGHTIDGTGHMVWYELGVVYDRDLMYSSGQCGVNGFFPDTFLVLLWQV
jgi:hypothetical protein